MAVNLKEQAEAHERAHQGLPFGTDEKPYWLDNETNESEQTANDNSTIQFHMDEDDEPQGRTEAPGKKKLSNQTRNLLTRRVAKRAFETSSDDESDSDRVSWAPADAKARKQERFQTARAKGKLADLQPAEIPGDADGDRGDGHGDSDINDRI